MNHLEQIVATANRGTTEMMARHNRAVEHLKFVIDEEVRRINKIAESHATNAELANAAVESFARIIEARAELP